MKIWSLVRQFRTGLVGRKESICDTAITLAKLFSLLSFAGFLAAVVYVYFFYPQFYLYPSIDFFDSKKSLLRAAWLTGLLVSPTIVIYFLLNKYQVRFLKKSSILFIAYLFTMVILYFVLDPAHLPRGRVNIFAGIFWGIPIMLLVVRLARFRWLAYVVYPAGFIGAGILIYFGISIYQAELTLVKAAAAKNPHLQKGHVLLRLVPDGRWYTMDFLKKELLPGKQQGDLWVTIRRESVGRGDNPYYWLIEVHAADGGLYSYAHKFKSELWVREVSKTGYTKEWSYVYAKTRDSAGIKTINQNLNIQSRDKTLYGHVALSIIPYYQGDAAIDMAYWINLKGSRTLYNLPMLTTLTKWKQPIKQ